MFNKNVEHVVVKWRRWLNCASCNDAYILSLVSSKTHADVRQFNVYLHTYIYHIDDGKQRIKLCTTIPLTERRRHVAVNYREWKKNGWKFMAILSDSLHTCTWVGDVASWPGRMFHSTKPFLEPGQCWCLWCWWDMNAHFHVINLCRYLDSLLSVCAFAQKPLRHVLDWLASARKRCETLKVYHHGYEKVNSLI